MVISTMVSCFIIYIVPLYNVVYRRVPLLLLVNKSHIVYKHFDRPLHIGSSDLTCMQGFRSLPLSF